MEHTLSEVWVEECNINDHLEIDEEEHNRLRYGPDKPWDWVVARPDGSVELVEKEGESSYYVSKYKEQAYNRRMKQRKNGFKDDGKDDGWVTTFKFVDGPHPPNMCLYDTREEARRKAEKEHNRMNINQSVGNNMWRFVTPNHAEIRFPNSDDKRAFVPFDYWLEIKDIYSTTLNGTPPLLRYHFQKQIIPGIPQWAGNTDHTNISHDIMDIHEDVRKVRFIDLNKLHCCPRNIRAVWPKHKPLPDMGRDKIVHIEPPYWPDGDADQEMRDILHWHCERWIWHLIPEDADPNTVPPYVGNTPHSWITVELYMGFRYWKIFNGVCNMNTCRQKREVDPWHWHEDGCIWHRIPRGVTKPFVKKAPVDDYFDYRSRVTAEERKGDRNTMYWVIRNSACHYDKCSEMKLDQPPYTKYVATGERTPAQIGHIMEEELRTGKPWAQLEQEREAAEAVEEEARRAEEEANRPKKRPYQKDNTIYWDKVDARKKLKMEEKKLRKRLKLQKRDLTKYKVPIGQECTMPGCKTPRKHRSGQCPLNPDGPWF